jgi:hypothetical protein
MAELVILIQFEHVTLNNTTESKCELSKEPFLNLVLWKCADPENLSLLNCESYELAISEINIGKFAI